jgi:hypothetical protein
MPPCLRPHAFGHFGQSARHDPNDPKAGALVLERTPSPWCSSARTALHAMTQMTQRRQATRAALDACRLAGWGQGAPGSGLAGSLLAAAGRWPGGRAEGHPVKITGSVRKKFFIF